MHDGQMLFDSTITWNKQEWKIDETSTNLINRNKIKPFIFVCIWNNGDKRRFEYMPQKPFEKLPKETQLSSDQVKKLGTRYKYQIISTLSY
jgi:hypothetical protein